MYIKAFSINATFLVSNLMPIKQNKGKKLKTLLIGVSVWNNKYPVNLHSATSKTFFLSFLFRIKVFLSRERSLILLSNSFLWVSFLLILFFSHGISLWRPPDETTFSCWKKCMRRHVWQLSSEACLPGLRGSAISIVPQSRSLILVPIGLITLIVGNYANSSNYMKRLH